MLFTARNLCKQYAAGTPGCLAVARVLDGLNLELRAGQIVGIAGERGSGKTTLVRCVAGLARPDAGALRWAPAAQRPRITARAPGAHPFETARDVINRACGDPLVSPDRMMTMLGDLALTGLLARSQAALTTDERARFALAIALATQHPLLLLDDTADAFVASVRPAVRTCLERHAAQGGAVLLTGRAHAGLLSLAGQVRELRNGRLQTIADAEAPRAPARVAERGIPRVIR